MLRWGARARIASCFEAERATMRKERTLTSPTRIATIYEEVSSIERLDRSFVCHVKSVCDAKQVKFRDCS